MAEADSFGIFQQRPAGDDLADALGLPDDFDGEVEFEWASPPTGGAALALSREALDHLRAILSFDEIVHLTGACPLCDEIRRVAA